MANSAARSLALLVLALLPASACDVLTPTDEAELADAWAEVTGHLVPAEPAPNIDFSAGQVLLVAMGERPSGGYGIDVTSLAEGSGTLYAVVDEVSPGADCLTTAALTQPVLVLRVPATEGDVTFVEQESVLDCS